MGDGKHPTTAKRLLNGNEQYIKIKKNNQYYVFTLLCFAYIITCYRYYCVLQHYNVALPQWLVMHLLRCYSDFNGIYYRTQVYINFFYTGYYADAILLTCSYRLPPIRQLLFNVINNIDDDGVCRNRYF